MPEFDPFNPNDIPEVIPELQTWGSVPEDATIPEPSDADIPIFTTAEEAWKAQQEHIEELKVDTLTGALTRVGFRHELKVDANLREALVAAFTSPDAADQESADTRPRSCGVIMLDVRGVKAANTLFGYAGGDEFLAQCMGIISHEVTSSARIRRRQDFSVAAAKTGKDQEPAGRESLDTVIRWGGDEKVIVVPHISPEQLEQLAGRLIVSFNGDMAAQRYAAGQVPIIAGVGWASSEELPDLGARPATRDGLFATVKTMVSIADARQTIDKSNQYAQMWAEYLRTLPRTHRALIDRPEDDSRIIELWWRTLFPDFIANPQRYLSPPRPSQEPNQE